MSEISIGDAIKAFLKKSPLKTGIQALQIEQVWEPDGKNHCEVH